jgi:hypothetical protein
VCVCVCVYVCVCVRREGFLLHNPIGYVLNIYFAVRSDVSTVFFASGASKQNGRL